MASTKYREARNALEALRATLEKPIIDYVQLEKDSYPGCEFFVFSPDDDEKEPIFPIVVHGQLISSILLGFTTENIGGLTGILFRSSEDVKFIQPIDACMIESLAEFCHKMENRDIVATGNNIDTVAYMDRHYPIEQQNE